MASKDIVRLDLAIAADAPEGRERTALVLAADRYASLSSLVELLVAHWDLPVWQETSIGYDLLSVGGAPLDLEQWLSDVQPGSGRLRLVAVPDRMVVGQSPADIPAFDVEHPYQQGSVTVLAAPAAITGAELRDRLEQWWDLPTDSEEGLVYYDLRLEDGSQPPLDAPLAKLGIGDDSQLALVPQMGLPIIAIEDDDSEILGEEDDEYEAAGDLIEVLGEAEQELADDRQSQPGPKRMAGSAQPSTTQTLSEHGFRKYLLQWIDDSFNTDELNELLFYLEIDRDEFEGNKRSRIIGLIQYYRRHNAGSLEGLLGEVLKMRPRVRQQFINQGYEALLPE